MPECGVTLGKAFAAAAEALRQAGTATPELDARLLLCHAAGLTHEAYLARRNEALQPDAAARFQGFIARRLAHEPVSRIVGIREFYGREFLVDRATLDPRPDTETLIDAALALVANTGRRERKLRLLDLGTGTGCILLTLLAELPEASGIGTDLSAETLSVAAANASRLGVAARATFVLGDWLDPIHGSFDVILSNPPYIPAAEIPALAREVADHDPRLALDGGRDGLDAYRCIAAHAGAALGPDGVLLLEIGAGQAEAVLDLLRAGGLVPSAVRPDLAGWLRCLSASRGESARPQRRSPKKDLEIRDVQVRFESAEGISSVSGARSEPRPVATATRADIS